MARKGARAAVTLVSAAADQKQSLGIQLLADLRTVFGDADVMFTDTTLEKLHKLEESPWGDLRGKELDAPTTCASIELGRYAPSTRTSERHPQTRPATPHQRLAET